MSLATYTHSNGKTIFLEEVCPKCKESGEQFYGTGFNSVGKEMDAIGDCDKCNGKGKIWLYYTIEQLEKLLEEKLPEDTAVWARYAYGPYGPERYAFIPLRYANAADFCVIRFPYQPVPSLDWRTTNE